MSIPSKELVGQNPDDMKALNRTVLLTLYTVPEDCPGRAECSGVITADGRLIKQNLELILFQIPSERNPFSSFNGQLLYSISFNDEMSLFDRMQEAAEKFHGTHSRRTNGSYDDGSFRILDRDKIIEYLRKLYIKPLSR
ncbi:MAG: hypothetical protein Q7S55_02835 [Nanoarchaeota archaeon]|nr:hypothetical protein [Nanoarchaeota archaeon]